MLQRRAPIIGGMTLLAAVIGEWSGVPVRILDVSAIAIGSLALALWAVRGLPLQHKSKEELGFTRNRDWFAYELTGKGSPRGFNLLGFLGIATVLLTGFQSLAFAGFALIVAWGIVSMRYPNDLNAADS